MASNLIGDTSGQRALALTFDVADAYYHLGLLSENLLPIMNAVTLSHHHCHIKVMPYLTECIGDLTNGISV